MKILHEIPQDEIAEIDVMSKRCNELHAIGPSYATVELEVKDLKSGEIVTRYGDLSRSWTRNYYNAIVTQTLCCGSSVLGTTYVDGVLAAKATGGAVTSGVYVTGLSRSGANEAGANQGWRGAVADATKGIVIGRGTGAEALNDYVLGTPVTEGTAANCMNYATSAAPVVTWDSGTRKFRAVGSRVITNNSAGSIGINETALYIVGCDVVTAATILCTVRDKLGAQVDVAPVSQVTVTYTLYSPALP